MCGWRDSAVRDGCDSSGHAAAITSGFVCSLHATQAGPAALSNLPPVLSVSVTPTLDLLVPRLKGL
jgi:hypothetical protein